MKEPEVKGWEIGENGRRFRRIGSCIEHEPEISINGVMIPVSEADAYRERVKEAHERGIKIVMDLVADHKHMILTAQLKDAAQLVFTPDAADRVVRRAEQK